MGVYELPRPPERACGSVEHHSTWSEPPWPPEQGHGTAEDFPSSWADWSGAESDVLQSFGDLDKTAQRFIDEAMAVAAARRRERRGGTRIS